MHGDSQDSGAGRSLLASMLSNRRAALHSSPNITNTEQHTNPDMEQPLVHRPAADAHTSVQTAETGESHERTLELQYTSSMTDNRNDTSTALVRTASTLTLYELDVNLPDNVNAAISEVTREGIQADLGATVSTEIGQVQEPEVEHVQEAEEEEPAPIETRSPLEVTRGFEQHKIHHIGFELSEGDTLVFVDFPSTRSTDSRRSVDCSGIGYRDTKFRVHSENLLKTESSKFSHMLSPSYQFRVQRRRKLVNKLPEGVKYVLDMTPPVEGDDLVFQMTELSVTPGIINWWRSSVLHRVDPSFVTGHDDICSCTIRRRSFANKAIPSAPPQEANQSSQAAPTSPTKQSKPISVVEQILRKKANNDNTVCETEDFRDIPDYCPFRHCCGIIRLFMMIEGHSIDLNSAIKVWTLYALSKIWECTLMVQQPISLWILSDLNMKFIEVLPEEALEIGYTLKLKETTGAAFRILVNELALKEAASNHMQKWPKQVTVFGRRTGDLSDELKNMVEHAGRALVDRMTQLHTAVHNPDMFDFWDISIWRRLRGLEQYLKCLPTDTTRAQRARLDLAKLMEDLPQRVTAIIDKSLNRLFLDTESLLQGMDTDRTSYVEPRDFNTLASILKDFNPIQRMLTSIPYMGLSTELEAHLFWRRPSAELVTPNYVSCSTLVETAERSLNDLFLNEPWSRNTPLLDDIFGPGLWDALVHPRDFPFISLDNLDTQIKEALRPNFQTVWIRHFPIPLNLTRHLLLNLDLNELKYLPLWAGGLDDGSGGVFEDLLPDAQLGAIGPGPSYHTGITVPSDGSISESMMEEIRGMNVRGSTTAGSVDVHDSISTVYRPDKVIADDVSVGTEQFTDTSSEFAQARFRVPAEHQATGQAIDYMVDTETDDSESVTTEQIFAGNDSDTSTEKGSVGVGVGGDEDFVMLD